MHHPVFASFARFRGVVPPRYHANFLGVVTQNAFIAGMITALGHKFPDAGDMEVDYPAFDEEYFEWIDLLEAVLEARDAFTMIELGAGYGRWLVNAAAAARQRRGDLRITLVGVEAEPTHFAWMTQHFQDNGLDPQKHVLIEAAIDAHDGVVSFYVGKPDEWYGQRIADHGDTERPIRKVKTINLNQILARLDSVDLIDLDIEGAELAVLTSAIGELDRRVKRIHIGTHTKDIEQGLRTLFRDHAWYKRNDYEVGSTELTQWGRLSFNNGVQTWINPRLVALQPTPAELSWLQWAMRSSEVRYGNLQDELHKLKAASDDLQRERDEHAVRAPAATTELERAPSLQAALTLAREAQARIRAMESSKFWKLRRTWFRLKRLVGLGMNE